MCRNIRPLFNYDPPATETEIHEAALQFVRKISGSPRPSRANQPVFETAVQEIMGTLTTLLDQLETTAPPRNREVDAQRARARSIKRFETR